MNYPYKYCLIVEHNDNYSFGSCSYFYCDYMEAEADYNHYLDDGKKCSLYRILKFDNFDL